MGGVLKRETGKNSRESRKRERERAEVAPSSREKREGEA